MEIYLWSMDTRDLVRLHSAGLVAPRGGGYGDPDRTTSWLAYLEGKLPDYPEKTLEADLANVRRRMEMIRTDQTSADSRLADYLLDFNPATTGGLLNLTMGGYFANGRIWVLHSRFRYFDPVKRRAGLPEDVSALVEKLGPDSADPHAGECKSRRCAHVGGAGRRIRRAPLRNGDGRRQNCLRQWPGAHGEAGTRRRRPARIQDDALRQPAHLRLSMGSRLVPGDVESRTPEGRRRARRARRNRDTPLAHRTYFRLRSSPSLHGISP